MGRRKERRLAAMSGAGRRVKLDLFAEPSGDLGGSSTLDEVGEDEILAESNSPSASGQKPQNPLQLLGQYSDEELDEDTNEGHNNAEDSSVGMGEESKIVAGKEAEDGEINHEKESSQKMEQILMDSNAASQGLTQDFEKESTKDICPDDLKKQTNNTEEATYPTAPDELLVEDVSSGWKIVLHEESNKYYYWNVLTGETSWEVPDVLAQEIGTSAERIIGDTEGKTDVLTITYKSTMPLDVEEDDITTRNANSKINSKTDDSADPRIRMDGSDEGLQIDSIEKEGNGDAVQYNRFSSVGGESQNGVNPPLHLIKRCENLLERLNSVQCSNCALEVQDLKLKCKLEVETRLSDINMLASHGLSLHPFWLHSEAQLERLECAVDSVTQQINSAAVSEFLATLETHEGASDDTEIDSSEKKASFSAVVSHATDTYVMPTSEAHNNGVTTPEHVPSVWNSSTFVNNVGGKSESTGTENRSDLNPEPDNLAVEDVDMDVDMEVEDVSPINSACGGESDAHPQVSTDLPNMHSTLSNGESTFPPNAEWVPPPPPDNEPFPPLPPDDEPFPPPPPPPEEPPETSYPPSHLGPVQAFPYSEQYTLSYLGSALYAQQYYEAASNVYATTPGMVNPVEPTTYYGLENGTLNPTSLVKSTAESSGINSEPVREEIAGSLCSLPESESNLLLKTNISAGNSSHVNVKAPPEGPEAQSSMEAPETSETTTSVSAAAAAAAMKAQSMVSRKKKRTVAVMSTLRSNKKVSSLVDKWKAAKEELHEEEEEEEPEDPIEILERKRKREIEKWRAQQIASGEAKDNANFQPLGGDWRERVKRRRAAKMKESTRSSPDAATDGNQQNDLLKLSKGLPSGWQAYWDESSKMVYYGNALTSQTSWIRPSD